MTSYRSVDEKCGNLFDGSMSVLDNLPSQQTDSSSFKEQGACYCGAVTLAFDPACISRILHCHCGQCRRLSGAAFSTWVSIGRDALQVSNEDGLATFDVTPNVTRYFCKRCGTHAFSASKQHEAIRGIPAGILHSQQTVAPQGHYFVDDCVPWHKVPDDLPQYGGPSGFEPLAHVNQLASVSPFAEPQLDTEPRLASVLLELKAREPIFHRPEWGASRPQFEGMTADDFWEIGASGRRYSRDFVLDTLEQRHATPHQDIWETRDFHCREIAPSNYLLTYTLIQGDRVTRRSTIWRHTPSDWKIVFHQGTVVDAATPSEMER